LEAITVRASFYFLLGGPEKVGMARPRVMEGELAKGDKKGGVVARPLRTTWGSASSVVIDVKKRGEELGGKRSRKEDPVKGKEATDD